MIISGCVTTVTQSLKSLDGVENVGKGGDVSIKVGSLTMGKGMLISVATATSGDGGSINIEAGSVSLDTKSSIQSASTGTGRASGHSDRPVLRAGAALVR